MAKASTGPMSVQAADRVDPIRRAKSVYGAVIRNAFLDMLAYRLRYFTGIITYLLFVSVHYFIWTAVFAARESNATINGFTLPEMVTYVSIGWIARSLYFSNIDYEINELVRSGQVSVYLLRPVNFHLLLVAQAAGETLFRLLFFTVPISGVILWLFPVELPASLGHFAWFLAATVMSFLILAEVNFITGLCAFWFKSIDGVMRAKYFLVQILSGLLLPLSFFPGWLQTVVELLPFKTISYLPLQLYLGKVPLDEAPTVLFEQLCWWVALGMLSYFVWRRAVRVLTLQGG
ncbi:MAG: ABC-2 family transporter protein [Bdellovibrionales bacterium]|nr:ABC-2 family transporter protein [Bdellovibrionales bacterium]